MVEAAGVEPASESDPRRVSTMRSSVWSALAAGPQTEQTTWRPALLISPHPRRRSGEASRLVGVLGACRRRGRPQDDAA